jgi:hypothetical protein
MDIETVRLFFSLHRMLVREDHEVAANLVIEFMENEVMKVEPK